ncbi:hypothetical protein EB796_016289 [Bugula neritina]|uniref:Secreted protein n=1 Tax=Bugula neritina TaxID=10212 RepID=A0A7J7JJ48_BUGNE|nr:hypothetical protein EB796_016289 [Bugula neritina]
MWCIACCMFSSLFLFLPICLDSPRPGSATPGEVSSPRSTNQDSSAMYIARPLSKSTTNISGANNKRPQDASSRHRRISAGTVSSNQTDHCK